MADTDAVRAYLADSEGVFGDAAEARGYLEDAFERFRITLGMLPDLAPGSRILELGSTPYFLTRLLRRRGLEVTLANWFGAGSGFGQQGTQVMTVPSTGERIEFTFDNFNCETDPFPYPDDTFDLVLFCEILEHLPNDPTRVLTEIHRVLAKPHGRMALTTPNATRAENLVKMVRGENIYEQLSGYGVYGRHNREYTVQELTSLLGDCGFVDIDVFTGDVHPPPAGWAASVGDASLEHRGDTLFALAGAEGETRWRYPLWLYSSRFALHRVIRPDVVVGVNDDLQMSGCHHLEGAGADRWRWTGSQPIECQLDAGPDGARSIRVEGRGAPVGDGCPLRLTISVAGHTLDAAIDSDDRPFVIDLPVALGPGRHLAVLRTDTTWRPANGDSRSLGFRLKRVALEPVPGV